MVNTNQSPESIDAARSGAPLTPRTSDDDVELAITSAQRMLLDFLREHDASCPLCGYNVRALTRPVCPECRQHLTLTVGMARLRMGWLFAALVPGFFSGIAAIFVAIPIFGRVLFGDGVWTIPLVVLDLFGWSSGLFALLLAFRTRWRIRFLALSLVRQRALALLIWAIHIGALGGFILFALIASGVL